MLLKIAYWQFSRMRHIVCGRGKDSKQTKMAHCCVVFCTDDIRYKERYRISQKLESNFTFIIFRIFTLTLVSWATVCKTVRPMLSDRCLSRLSCLSLLSVSL